MDKKAWVHQLKKQIEKQGADRASWYVSWTEPNGKQRRKSCGPGKVGKSAANKLADTIHAQLVCGSYQPKEKTTWDQFFSRYTTHIEGRYDAPSRAAAMLSLTTFARVAKPKLLKSVDTATIDQFIGKRLKENRTRKASDGTFRTVSPATVNRELRYVKAALRLCRLGVHRQSRPDAVSEAATEVADVRLARTLRRDLQSLRGRDDAERSAKRRAR